MGYDPTGRFDWTNFSRGAGWLTVGITAISIGITILSCGTAAPAMLAVAVLTVGAGGLTAINGAAEIGEAFTDYNFVRDTVFSGNQASYDLYANITATTAEIGTAILGAYYTAKGGNVCFIAGTLVQGSDGPVPIESIEAGDLVWAWDEETGEVALKEVVQTFENQTTELVRVTVKGEEIVCTREHPFYSPVKGWTAACKLRAGDILVTVNGEYVVVEKIQHEILEAPIPVYNFEVEGFHTYYVADSGVLVHNRCHGNSLNSPKQTDLYVLRDNTTGAVQKIGETTRGVQRYSKGFYAKHNVHMQIIDSGSKRAMHYQQHRLLARYYSHIGRLPVLNKSFW